MERTLSRYNNGQDLCPTDKRGSRAILSLSDHAVLLRILHSDDTLFLKEIARQLTFAIGKHCNKYVVLRGLQRLGITHKKVRRGVGRRQPASWHGRAPNASAPADLSCLTQLHSLAAERRESTRLFFVQRCIVEFKWPQFRWYDESAVVCAPWRPPTLAQAAPAGWALAASWTRLTAPAAGA